MPPLFHGVHISALLDFRIYGDFLISLSGLRSLKVVETYFEVQQMINFYKHLMCSGKECVFNCTIVERGVLYASIRPGHRNAVGQIFNSLPGFFCLLSQLLRGVRSSPALCDLSLASFHPASVCFIYFKLFSVHM